MIEEYLVVDGKLAIACARVLCITASLLLRR